MPASLYLLMLRWCITTKEDCSEVALQTWCLAVVLHGGPLAYFVGARHRTGTSLCSFVGWYLQHHLCQAASARHELYIGWFFGARLLMCL